MTYSNTNQAWGRLQQNRADDERRDVIDLARHIQKTEPGWSWGEALRRAEMMTAGDHV